MSVQTPASRPHASLTQVMFQASAKWADCHPDVTIPEFFVLGVRGYYSETIAPPGNNYGVYDDAFFIVSPIGFSTWNGNTDPSRQGWNPHADKYMARLKPGCWRYQRVIHRGKYQAFGQADHEVTVERVKQDGSIAQTETGCFGINLHLGGENGTSSEGCMTLVPSQWDAFRSTLNKVIDTLKVHVFDLILIEGPIT